MLAERARVSAEAISALERGRRKTPQRETLELLIDALEPHAGLRAQLRAAAIRPSAPSRRTVPHPAAAIPAKPLRAGRLPRPLTAFFGRAAELKTLAHTAGKHRLVTLTGTGGVGKTRTALELAFRLADTFADGAWFVELGPLRDAALVPKAIAAAFDIAERPETPLLEVIGATLRERRLLLVLDNCEHLIEAAAEAAHTILTHCPRVTIVAASREPLRVDGEAVYRLTALDVPRDLRELNAQTALRYSAVELLVERSRARDSTFALSEHNTRHAVEICRRLDGIPLAIELAAAKTSVLSLAEIAARLDNRFSLLTGGTRNALARHQTLQALIAWSFDLLDEREALLLCCLGVFTGSWTIAAAEAVSAAAAIPADDVIGLLSSLVDKSLVTVDPASPDTVRFRLLETTREYAAAKLAGRGAFGAVMRAQTAYVLAFARRARTLLKDAADTQWLDMVGSELESIRTALEWSLRDKNDVAAGAEIAAAIGFFWDSRSCDEGMRWLRAAHTALGELDGRLAALVLQELVRIQPSGEQTFALAQRALQAYRAVDDDAGVATALEYVGQTLINLGRFAEAVGALEEGVGVARRTQDEVAILHLLVLLAFANLYRGDGAAAVGRLNEARGLVAAHTRLRDHALVLRLDAEIALANGDHERALAVAEDSLKLSQRIGDRRGIGIAHYVVAHALAEAGRPEQARAHCAAAVARLAGAQIPFALAEAYFVAASVYARAADDERAARLMGFARACVAKIPFRVAFLIRGLADRSAAMLVERLGPERFDALATEGAAFDERRASAELDAGDGTTPANGDSHV